MTRRLGRVATICLCCLITGSSASWAQESHLDAPGEIPKYVREPIPLFTTGLGPFKRPISSRNAEAQAFFTQGFQMMYAFARLDAVRVPRSLEARSRVRHLLLGGGLGVAAGVEGAEQNGCGGGCRPGEELVAVRHLDSRVAL